MSKHINVNPDHYKTAGRERPGDGIARSTKHPETDAQKTKERWEKRQRERERTGRQK